MSSIGFRAPAFELRILRFARTPELATMAANDAALQANSATEQVSKDEIDTPLAELVSDETGQTGKWDLQVAGQNLQGSNIVEYSYQWQGSTIYSKKLVIILKSSRPQQYCLGVARMKKKDEKELKM